ncbi:FRG domain-containing protein [Abiotrophia sp.]|uniref:FRG domain-containing protein n=1 Tax=Abiotrophia sp. TaxID=76631 RepID=UPI00345C9D03
MAHQQKESFVENIKEYYKYMAPSLSSLELENFLAFCQHHGLRTPLIEITSALYFAVKDKEGVDDPSVIYI